MEYLRIENDFPRISHSAVTLGKFDGIHRGHQKLVEKIIEQKQEGAQAVVLALGTASRTILTKEERCRILKEMGVDILLECPLTEKIRHMKAGWQGSGRYRQSASPYSGSGSCHVYL